MGVSGGPGCQSELYSVGAPSDKPHPGRRGQDRDKVGAGESQMA